MSMTLAKNIRKFPKALVTIVRFASTVPSKTIEVEKPINTFYHHDLEIFHATRSQMKLKPLSWDNLKFGQVYTDHMMEVDWNQSKGWSKPLISPLHNFDIHPGAKVLHYAIELFEGMKAFRGVDNKIRLFRPEKNIERMKRSAIRATLPDFDAEELIKLISNTIEIDKEWVPYSDTGFLYIRPTMIGTDPTIGVAVSTQAKLFVLLNPVGTSTGFQPVSLLADPEYVRAFSGGVGAYKMGCNYAPTLLVGKIAHKMGCHQALWLYDTDEKLTEASAMNIFVYWKNENGEEELVTPPLEDGLILPGVTRDSILVLAREWNEFKISERYPTMEEIQRSLKEKRMLQMFCTGTASGIVPVNRIVYKNKKTKECENLLLPTMESRSNLVKRFYDTILDIQYGRVERFGWTRIVC